MAFKFPFTNYHELNLTWVLDQLKALFEKSEENVTTIETYENRLTAVETELPSVSETASEASRAAAAAGSLAETAKATADTAQNNATQAQGLAGTARQEAQAAQTAANEATQAAQQAQATAQNFDGRITQAENDASQALESSRSFENRVQSAITTANNAAQTATNAQGIATRADQNAALALDTLNAQRSELERIGAEQAALITEETESGKTEIETLAQSVLDSIPSDYTTLSNLVDKKAPVIINRASGAVASFNDGADNMKIQKLVVNIEPLQAGSGDPSPHNVRPISGWTGAEIEQMGANVWDEEWELGDLNTNTGGNYPASDRIRSKNYIPCKQNGSYYLKSPNNAIVCFYGKDKSFLAPNIIALSNSVFTKPQNAYYMRFAVNPSYGTVYKNDISINYPATDTQYHPYTGNKISVNWEDEAGTVYGGTLTLNPDRTGTLVVDRAMSLVKDLEWRNNGSNIFQAELPLAETITVPPYNNRQTGLVTSAYPVSGSVSFSSSMTDKSWLRNQNFVYIRDTSYTSAEDFAAAMEEVQLLYKLANNQTIQLTAEQVSGILSTLYGTNNIWANAGPVSVDYPADTKLYIDGKLAELQATILENI